MFEEILIESTRRTQKTVGGLSLPLSIALHALIIGATVAASSLKRNQRIRTPTGMSQAYLRGIAGKRFRVRFVGSTVIPTDSSAVAPRMGSAFSGPKMIRPAVTSPMNSI